jgi:hypothetical protein
MISGRLSLFLFPALLLVAAVFALRTVGDLPEMVRFILVPTVWPTVG